MNYKKIYIYILLQHLFLWDRYAVKCSGCSSLWWFSSTCCEYLRFFLLGKMCILLSASLLVPVESFYLCFWALAGWMNLISNRISSAHMWQRRMRTPAFAQLKTLPLSSWKRDGCSELSIAGTPLAAVKEADRTLALLTHSSVFSAFTASFFLACLCTECVRCACLKSSSPVQLCKYW